MRQRGLDVFSELPDRHFPDLYGNAKVFEKVYFPRMVMPISTVLTNMITFFIQFALFLVLMVYFLLAPGSVIHPNPGLILLTIPALVQMAVLGLGFGIIISALTTKYRDRKCW